MWSAYTNFQQITGSNSRTTKQDNLIKAKRKKKPKGIKKRKKVVYGRNIELFDECLYKTCDIKY